MIFRSNSRNQRRIMKPVDNCRFCKNNEEPTYKKWEVLSHYISERGKILPRVRTGVCSSHVRTLSLEIKRARHLALVPFTVRPQ